MRFQFNDGGRRAAGFKGSTSDCVCRAIAIVSGLPYREVYDRINEYAAGEKFARGRVGVMAATGRGSSARTGVMKPTTKAILADMGYVWTPTMRFGQGCRVHLRASELPAGRLIVQCSRHITAVIDGVIHDTYDPSRDGTRCVYGYWSKS